MSDPIKLQAIVTVRVQDNEHCWAIDYARCYYIDDDERQWCMLYDDPLEQDGHTWLRCERCRKEAVG